MIKILVDSSADFRPEEIALRGIDVVPLGVSIGGTDYQDGIDLSRDRFYELLTSTREFPKTTMPAPAAFVNRFEQAGETGDQIICLLVSSALSGTLQCALTARDMVGYNGIHIIDTRMTAAGMRILADHALHLIDEGLSAADIVAELEALKGRVRIFAALDTLEYLYKGGRLSRAAAAVGTIANLKPIATLTAEGTVAVARKSMSRTKARGDLLDIIRSGSIDPSFPTYSIYTSGTENVEYLEEQLAASGITVTSRTQIGPAIGSHVGPGVYGLFFVERVQF